MLEKLITSLRRDIRKLEIEHDILKQAKLMSSLVYARAENDQAASGC